MNRESLPQPGFLKQTLVSGGVTAAGVATAEVGVAQDSLSLKVIGIAAGISGILNFFRALDSATRARPRKMARRK